MNEYGLQIDKYVKISILEAFRLLQILPVVALCLVHQHFHAPLSSYKRMVYSYGADMRYHRQILASYCCLAFIE